MTHPPLLTAFGGALDALRARLDATAAPRELARALAGTLGAPPPPGTPLPVAPFVQAVESAVCLTLYALADASAPPPAGGDGQAAALPGAAAEPGGAAWFGRPRGRRPRREADGPPAEAAPAPMRVSVAKVLDSVRAALEAADQVLDAAIPRPAEPEPLPWSEDRELIDMLHDVLAAGARGREGFALRRIADLEESLLAHGIQTLRYDPDDGAEAGDPVRFDFVEGARPGEPGMTLAPALVDLAADSRTLRRGRVRPAPAGPHT
ncbi:hypothetical protein RKE29_05100 [Streptomyces sp. B1866]|uniref:hypothetical protein n=1 Tax=Streptomyces sp. B1866 TaxID=3075431 RepID=UPI002890F6ED|nr:hypothetical protein [Streptomyces sp. B1866]MDT3396024.1 hypothetical protein [Streptomyces sp. B1866]